MYKYEKIRVGPVGAGLKTVAQTLFMGPFLRLGQWAVGGRGNGFHIPPYLFTSVCVCVEYLLTVRTALVH